MKRKKNNPAPPEWRRTLARFLQGAKRLAIMGIGEREKGDDGAGSRLAGRLARAVGHGAGDTMLILDGGAMPESHTGVIRRFSPSHLLIIDAACASRAAGDIFVMSEAELGEEELSTHRLPLTLLIRFLRSTLSCELLLLCIQPLGLQGKRLTAPVKRALDLLQKTLQKELTRVGR